MKKILLLSCLLVSTIVVFATTTTVTPANYESVYNSAGDGDILMLDAGTYATALEFPSGKTITLKKFPAAASMPILTFGWLNTAATIAGSGLILDSLDIDYANQNYFISLMAGCIVDKLIFKN